MINNDVLAEALSKKNKEVDKLVKQNEEQKKNYELKIKNLMNSIENLKSKNTNLESTTKDNIRVSIINKLKEERKDQEQVINHLRKLIADDDKVDRFLLKEFDKKGNDHIPTYEELKLKIKQLESEIVSIKYKQMTNTKIKTNPVSKSEEDTFQLTSTINTIQKLKEDIIKYEEKIEILTEENSVLISSKEKMEKIQNELFEKFRIYNKEINEIKSIYDVIKKNIEDECEMKTNDLMNKLRLSSTENEKLKEKINELIELSDINSNKMLEKLKNSNSENEILKRILESKIQEMKIISAELEKYQSHFDKLDNKEIVKNKKIEREKDEINKKNIENETKIKFQENILMQKDYQLELLKKSLSDKDEILNEKDLELELLNGKIQELESIAIENYKKYQNINIY